MNANNSAVALREPEPDAGRTATGVADRDSMLVQAQGRLTAWHQASNKYAWIVAPMRRTISARFNPTTGGKRST